MTLVFSSKTYFFNVEVAAIAAIVLSVALIVYVLLSIWGITGFPE